MGMAQQRVLRPSDFADVRFVGCDPAVHHFYLGLRVLADDRGVVCYKLKLFLQHWPLLGTAIRSKADTLVEIGVVKQYEIEGTIYWAIRDFARDFTVSRPGFRHPLPDELWEWVGWTRQMQEAARDRSAEGRGRRGGSRLARDPELKLDFTPPPPKVMPDPAPVTAIEAPSVAAPCSPDQVLDPGEDDSGDPGSALAVPAPALGRKPQPAREYAFKGNVIRLVQKDFDAWKIEYSRIPDFMAALRACDEWLASQSGKTKTKWYVPARAYMQKRHQSWAAKPSPGRPSQQHPNSAAAIMRRLASEKSLPGVVGGRIGRGSGS